MVCIASSTGRRADLDHGMSPGPDAERDPEPHRDRDEIMIRASVSRLASQNPSTPKERNPMAARSAMRHPASHRRRRRREREDPSHVRRESQEHQVCRTDVEPRLHGRDAQWTNSAFVR